MIEQKDDAIRELGNRLEGYHTCTRSFLERINGNIIETQMKFGSNDVYSFEANIYKIANGTDMFETNIMHLFSNILVVVVLDVIVY